MNTLDTHIAALRASALDAEALEWHASAQNDGQGSSAGLNDTDKSASPPSSTDSLPLTMLRLASAMESQNDALWALVHQTAALIALLMEGDGEQDDDGEPTRYLDGSRIS